MFNGYVHLSSDPPDPSYCQLDHCHADSAFSGRPPDHTMWGVGPGIPDARHRAVDIVHPWVPNMLHKITSTGKSPIYSGYPARRQRRAPLTPVSADPVFGISRMKVRARLGVLVWVLGSRVYGSVGRLRSIQVRGFRTTELNLQGSVFQRLGGRRFHPTLAGLNRGSPVYLKSTTTHSGSAMFGVRFRVVLGFGSLKLEFAALPPNP